MASIRKRTKKDGSTSYRVDIRLKGHPAERATFTRLTDAKAWAQDTESAIRDGRYFKTRESQKHTLGDLIDRYIREVLPIKPKQAADQKQQLEWFKAEIGAHINYKFFNLLMTQSIGFLIRCCYYLLFVVAYFYSP